MFSCYFNIKPQVYTILKKKKKKNLSTETCNQNINSSDNII